MGQLVRPPYEGVLIGATPTGLHARATAQLVNTLEFGPATVFINCVQRTITSGAATSAFRHICPLRRWGLVRRWSVRIAEQQQPGLLKLVPGVAPVNASDPGWSEGQWVPTPTGVRRATQSIDFFEVVDGGGYTLPSSAAELTYTLQYFPNTGASQTLKLLGVSCHELGRVQATSGVGGVDTDLMRERFPIFSKTSADLQGGVRQILARVDQIIEDGNRRKLFDWYDPDGDIILSGQAFTVPIAMLPRRRYRTDPGWSYTPVRVHVRGFGGDGLVTTLVKTEKNPTGVSITWTGTQWVSDVIDMFCQATIIDVDANPRVASLRGMITGRGTGIDTDAEAADRSSSWEDTMTFEETNNVGGEGGGGSGIRGYSVIDELA